MRPTLSYHPQWKSGLACKRTNKRICIVHVMDVVHRKPCLRLYVGRKMHVLQGHDKLLLRDRKWWLVVLTFYQPRIIFYFVQLAISKICAVCVSSNTCSFRRLCFFCFVYGMGHAGVLWHSRFKTIQKQQKYSIWIQLNWSDKTKINQILK